MFRVGRIRPKSFNLDEREQEDEEGESSSNFERSCELSEKGWGPLNVGRDLLKGT